MATVEVLVGVLGRPHGVRGEVAVALRTDEPARRFGAGQRLRLEDSTRTLTVVATREANQRFLVRFAELEDRVAAEAVRGGHLVVDVDAAETPQDPREFYDRQLVGLTVLDAAGTSRGRVAAVQHLPGQDLLEIATSDGVRLVPFVAALVPDIDVGAGWLRLADVGGLLADDAAE